MADNEQKNDKKESKDDKPTGRVGMGAATVIINDGAGI